MGAPPVYFLCNFLFSLLLLILLGGHGINGNQDNCPRSFDCGNLGSFRYPFTKAKHPDCGLLLIHDCGKSYASPKKIQLEKNGKGLDLIGVVQQNAIVTLFDEDLHTRLEQNACDTLNHSYSVPSPSPPLASVYTKYNVTLFRCKRHLNIKPPAHSFVLQECPAYDIYYDESFASGNNKEDAIASSSFSNCSVVTFPSKGQVTNNITGITSLVSAEMVVEVVLSHDCDQCYNHRGGQCRLETNNKFYCDKGGKGWVVMKSGVALGLVTLVVLVMITLYYTRWKKQNPTHVLVDAFLEGHGNFQIKRYSYSEIKKLTNSFKNKLGQGGFGSVYKGQLQDGRHVAVKVLSELKGDGEDFINEVASMSKTSHVNIVALLGFCFEGSKQALVYEFMPNGSLEKFIYEENVVTVDCQLDCQTLYDIAIGVARGLEYLHRGCNTRILHFDIKPHNILLDENLCPKISDFGLAKVCTRKESMVSIFGARGTAGYIAPEVFSRNFGLVSHKSDVYSYGMMVLEMVGKRKNIEVEVDASSEIYFPHWIYNRLVSSQELGLRNMQNESDNEKARKMTIVSLWCIQTNPSTRPSISQVVEMLEGSVELLQLPPKPFWFSPSTSPDHLSRELIKV